jgi:hypothetical protein
MTHVMITNPNVAIRLLHPKAAAKKVATNVILIKNKGIVKK